MRGLYTHTKGVNKLVATFFKCEKRRDRSVCHNLNFIYSETEYRRAKTQVKDLRYNFDSKASLA